VRLYSTAFPDHRRAQGLRAAETHRLSQPSPAGEPSLLVFSFLGSAVPNSLTSSLPNPVFFSYAMAQSVCLSSVPPISSHFSAGFALSQQTLAASDSTKSKHTQTWPLAPRTPACVFQLPPPPPSGLHSPSPSCWRAIHSSATKSSPTRCRSKRRTVRRSENFPAPKAMSW
jgi:hypothetical protein